MDCGSCLKLYVVGGNQLQNNVKLGFYTLKKCFCSYFSLEFFALSFVFFE